MSQRILLFGGAFNPPHLGHLLVIEQAFELIPDLKELWLLPVYRHTFNKELAPAADRLEMCRLLAESINRPVKVNSIEIDRQTSGSTLETLHLLQSDNPAVSFSFLMGSDQLPAFPKWTNWEQLLQELPFYVYPRAGFPMEPLYPHMTPLTSDTQVVTNISSTLTRQRLVEDLSTHTIIPALIARYIAEHHLYTP